MDRRLWSVVLAVLLAATLGQTFGVPTQVAPAAKGAAAAKGMLEVTYYYLPG
ncbi:MAG TPA: hypothetical protein VFW45_08690 [Candidatus Polarisedimenticolia bacterium]|nr:hypothetical protein [Candidatus Polarisedimenticolia bacterium]